MLLLFHVQYMYVYCIAYKDNSILNPAVHAVCDKLH